MAALIIDRQPVAAVIYNFAEDQLYTAVKDEGAYKNGVPIHVSSRELDNSYIENWNSLLYSEVYHSVKPYGIRTLQSMGASGRSFSLIAEGKIDGGVLIDSPAAIHDRAPGALLIQEAGGEIVSFDSDWTIDTENYVIATPKIAEFFRTHLDEMKTSLIIR
jgi:myo-inositol-1(or 4)-monophosphatase